MGKNMSSEQLCFAIGGKSKGDPGGGHFKEGTVLIVQVAWILKSRESLLST